jgi:putative transposase
LFLSALKGDEVALCDDVGLEAMRRTDLTVHLVWVLEYPKSVLTGPVGVRVRNFLSQIAMENYLQIISCNVATDHVHMFISHRAHLNISQIVQWLNGTNSRLLFQEFPYLKKQYWGQHLWARGYIAVTSCNITDEMINDYIND